MSWNRRGNNRPFDALPEATVPSETYDDHYFRSVCLGSDEWSDSDGTRVAGVYPGVLQRAGFRAGEILVDIGTGRGELLAVAVQQGAKRAIGLEYAEAALGFAVKTLRSHGVSDRAGVLMADSRAIPLCREVADLVTMIDVVEHLTPAELDATLREAHRILKPGGRVLIHTMPSRTIYKWTYQLLRLSRPRRMRTWPSNPRNEFEQSMHVNEQTVTKLGRALKRAAFRPSSAQLGSWVYTAHVPDERAKRVYQVLAKIPLLNRFGIGDIWGQGVRPAIGEK